MAKYLVHEAGVAHVRELIAARRYVLRSEWGRVQPTAEDEECLPGEALVGRVRRVHRMGIIACHYRAAEWGHKEVELAVHELLQLLDHPRLRTAARGR
jgi:hypothetical protein